MIPVRSRSLGPGLRNGNFLCYHGEVSAVEQFWQANGGEGKLSRHVGV